MSAEYRPETPTPSQQQAHPSVVLAALNSLGWTVTQQHYEDGTLGYRAANQTGAVVSTVVFSAQHAMQFASLPAAGIHFVRGYRSHAKSGTPGKLLDYFLAQLNEHHGPKGNHDHRPSKHLRRVGEWPQK